MATLQTPATRSHASTDSQHVPPHERQSAFPGQVIPAAAAILAAVVIAGGIYAVNVAIDVPERAVMAVAGMFALLFPMPACVYLLVRRRDATPSTLGLTILLSAVVLLLATALYWMAGRIFFPADILIWAESEFVNDLIKLRVGYPLYTPEVNNESFIYLPGAQLLTYLLASLVGQETSVPALRMVQVVFTLGTTAMAILVTRTLLRIATPDRGVRNATLWSALWAPFFFLVATNQLTNPFTHLLHNDALALLISIAAFWLLLKYVQTRSPRVLVAMALVPAVGVLVKQNLLIWGGFYLLYLIVFDRPRSWRRIVALGASSAIGVGLVLASAYLVWGEPFVYWAFEVLGERGAQISPLRVFQHVMDVWVYFAIGIIGGVVLLRGRQLPLLIGPFVIWLLFISAQAYTTGVAWMLHHMGPGCLIAATWFAAAVARLWSDQVALPADAPIAERWIRPAAWGICGLLLMSGLSLVRIPLPSIPADAQRYISQVEDEFEGIPTDRVLMDAGSWVYMREGVVMKDRATNIGDRGMAQNGDFSGIIGRIRDQHYDRILVRNYHSDIFWYDHDIWAAPSGIYEALQSNYQEVRIIPAVDDPLGLRPLRYLFQDVYVLEPRPAEPPR